MAENAREQIRNYPLDGKGSDAYKPQAVPNAMKVIKGDLKPPEEKVGRNGAIPVKVEQRGGLRLIAKKCVGLKHIFEGPFIKESAQELTAMAMAEKIPGWKNRHIHYGIAPITELQQNPDTHTYYIGIEVEHFEGVPDGLECLVIPAGTYAVIHKSLSAHASDLYGVWSDGWEKQSTGYTYEYFYESISEYSERVNGMEKAFEMDLCIPLKSSIVR